MSVILADYPDAFTINMAKVLQEGRWGFKPICLPNSRMLEYYNANDEVEQLIRRLFRNEEEERICEVEEEDPYGQVFCFNIH